MYVLRIPDLALIKSHIFLLRSCSLTRTFHTILRFKRTRSKYLFVKVNQRKTERLREEVYMVH